MRLSYLIAFAIAAAVAAWVVSGQLTGDTGAGQPQLAAAPADRPPAAPAAETAEPAQDGIMTVRTVTQSAVERAREIRVRGQTEVSRSVIARAEVGGAVTEILVSKGDRVTAGQVLARLDLADRVARQHGNGSVRVDGRRHDLGGCRQHPGQIQMDPPEKLAVSTQNRGFEVQLAQLGMDEDVDVVGRG